MRLPAFLAAIRQGYIKQNLAIQLNAINLFFSLVQCTLADWQVARRRLYDQ